jgi:hypothetical protein
VWTQPSKLRLEDVLESKDAEPRREERNREIRLADDAMGCPLSETRLPVDLLMHFLGHENVH